MSEFDVESSASHLFTGFPEHPPSALLLPPQGQGAVRAWQLPAAIDVQTLYPRRCGCPGPGLDLTDCLVGGLACPRGRGRVPNGGFLGVRCGFVDDAPILHTPPAETTG